MSSAEIGERVGALLGIEDRVVAFLGYGIYEGEHIPAEAVGDIADLARLARMLNPRIIDL